MTASKKITRENLQKVSIISSLQRGKTGCMWHSIYALTHDREFLNYTYDNSAPRFMITVQNKGYFLWPLLAIPKHIKITNEIWDKLGEKCKEESNLSKMKLKLLVSTLMNDSDSHMIAVEGDFENDKMQIMDPVGAKLIPPMTWNAILNSDYKNIYEILVVESGDIDDYQKVPPS